jgi:glutaminyl-tRNA synthetase
MGTRALPFTREIYIDASDFAEVPPPKFFRLKPEGEVRLMGAYIIKYQDVVKDENGNIVEIHCTADLETRNGNPTDGRKIKGTIHWLSAPYAKDARLMLYDKLFTIENVGDIPEDKTYNDYLNPDSLVVCDTAKVEPALFEAAPSEKFQFVRNGYFCKDTKYENTFNRIVGLKDSFAKKN